MARGPDRFDVYLAALDPVRGSEVAKTRPCTVVSPPELNARLRTVIVVPLTSKPKGFPHRIRVGFGGVEGELLTDHIRAVDKSRLIRRLGILDEATSRRLVDTLVAMFRF